jgi:hypothetical protein
MRLMLASIDFLMLLITGLIGCSMRLLRDFVRCSMRLIRGHVRFLMLLTELLVDNSMSFLVFLFELVFCRDDSVKCLGQAVDQFVNPTGFSVFYQLVKLVPKLLLCVFDWLPVRWAPFAIVLGCNGYRSETDHKHDPKSNIFHLPSPEFSTLTAIYVNRD